MSFLSVPVSVIPVRNRREINGIQVNVIINEDTNDTLTITKQPVQQGAAITDHAFKEPTTLSMTAYFADNSFSSQVNQLLSLFSDTSGSNPLAAIYNQFLDLQATRQPFDVITPKRIYKNMLMASLGLTTDKNTENIVALHFAFQEVLLVSVSTALIPRNKQRIPQVTAKTEPAGKKSALLDLGQGAQSLLSVIPR